MKQWQVIAGDCRVLLPRMAPGSVDFIFADPSYGHNNNSDDLIARREAVLGEKQHRCQSPTRPIRNDGPRDGC